MLKFHRLWWGIVMWVYRAALARLKVAANTYLFWQEERPIQQSHLHKTSYIHRFDITLSTFSFLPSHGTRTERCYSHPSNESTTQQDRVFSLHISLPLALPFPIDGKHTKTFMLSTLFKIFVKTSIGLSSRLQGPVGLIAPYSTTNLEVEVSSTLVPDVEYLTKDAVVGFNDKMREDQDDRKAKSSFSQEPS